MRALVAVALPSLFFALCWLVLAGVRHVVDRRNRRLTPPQAVRQTRAELHREAQQQWEQEFLRLAAQAPLPYDRSGYGRSYILRGSRPDGSVYINKEGRL